jgi:hypothetical protein
MQPLLCRSGYAKAMLDFSLVRFFASRQRNEQPANHAVREELAMFLSFDNTNTMVYLSLKYRYYQLPERTAQTLPPQKNSKSYCSTHCG